MCCARFDFEGPGLTAKKSNFPENRKKRKRKTERCCANWHKIKQVDWTLGRFRLHKQRPLGRILLKRRQHVISCLWINVEISAEEGEAEKAGESPQENQLLTDPAHSLFLVQILTHYFSCCKKSYLDVFSFRGPSAETWENRKKNEL